MKVSSCCLLQANLWYVLWAGWWGSQPPRSWLLYPCLSSPRWQPQGPQLCRVQHHGHTGASSFTTIYNLICFECKTKIQLLQDCSSPGDPELEAVDRALSPDTSEDTDSVHSGASGGGSRGQYIKGTFTKFHRAWRWPNFVKVRWQL